MAQAVSSPMANVVHDKALATQMAQEARLFRALYQRRRLQHASALAEARRAAAEAAGVEEKLLFAQDRAEFAREQLKRIEATSATLAAAAPRPDEASIRWKQMEHDRQFEAAEAVLKKRQELRQELCQRRFRSALAVARLRALRGLCELGLQNDGTDSLASTIQRCEEDLLSAGGSRTAAEPLAAELEAASPLGLAVPLLQGKKLGDIESSTLDATAGSVHSGSGGGAADGEEARLRRLVADLTAEREALRVELREASVQSRRCRVAPERCTAAEVAMLKRELADAYAALAGAGDPAALEAELASLRVRCGEAKAERAALEARVADARGGTPSTASGATALSGGEPQAPPSAAELTVLVARNQKEIADLKEKLRVEEEQLRAGSQRGYHVSHEALPALHADELRSTGSEVTAGVLAGSFPGGGFPGGGFPGGGFPGGGAPRS